ncbi:MAG: copper chaperone [Chitinophagaceae bacterium]|nr:MAG: copper chaperone [Chitinophagaceae bacterium]
MKYLQLSLIALLGFIFSASAQVKVVDRATISTPGLQCEMCKTKIETYLMRQDGIKAVKVDLKKKVVGVQWITDRTNIENIKTMIANLGFDADDVTKEESAYKRLPPCCKIPATDVTSPVKP